MDLCRLAWVDQKRRQVLYQRYIRTTQVLYQLPIKTSSEDSCIAANEAIRNFCGSYYRVDDINYLCHVRCGMFPRNKSLALVIYCVNIPNGRDITNRYTCLDTWIANIIQYHIWSLKYRL
jgi:hypothetical protein